MHKRWIVVAVAVGVAFGCTGLAMAATGSSRSVRCGRRCT